jgi:hypothetical protein
MTGNVAQVFLTDEEWDAALHGIHGALRPGGRVVFETRDPQKQAWRDWTRENTYIDTVVDGVGRVRTWDDLLEAAPPLVTFESVVILPDGERLQSTSTLRFRGREEVEASLARTGFSLEEVRDAPDRPGREFVFVATAG